MDEQQRRLALTIALGGTLVLASYTLVFVFSPAVVDALWGGVPDSLRGAYTVNMFLAAGGFFPLTAPLLWGRDSRSIEAEASTPYSRLLWSYVAILVPSALWLPLTAWMIESPGAALWATVRIDLLLVAAGSLSVWFAAWRRALSAGGAAAWAAVLGGLFFCLQTVVLDALIWPAYYPTPGV